jgi:hypothetical protein
MTQQEGGSSEFSRIIPNVVELFLESLYDLIKVLSENLAAVV